MNTQHAQPSVIVKMSSDEEDYGYDCSDSGNESPDVGGDDVDDDDFGMDIGLGEEPGPSSAAGGSGQDKSKEEEYQYEVLTAEQIVEHMVECIKEVNNVVEVSELDFICRDLDFDP